MANFLAPMLEILRISGRSAYKTYNTAAHVKPGSQKLSPLLRLPLILELVEKTRKD